jgi:hypothetical protein
MLSLALDEPKAKCCELPQADRMPPSITSKQAGNRMGGYPPVMELYTTCAGARQIANVCNRSCSRRSGGLCSLFQQKQEQQRHRQKRALPSWCSAGGTPASIHVCLSKQTTPSLMRPYLRFQELSLGALRFERCSVFPVGAISIHDTGTIDVAQRTASKAIRTRK